MFPLFRASKGFPEIANMHERCPNCNSRLVRSEPVNVTVKPLSGQRLTRTVRTNEYYACGAIIEYVEDDPDGTLVKDCRSK
jgi:hypothetical protein